MKLIYDFNNFWFGDTYETKNGTRYINFKSKYDLERIKIGVYFIKHEYKTIEESEIKHIEYSNRKNTTNQRITNDRKST